MAGDDLKIRKPVLVDYSLNDNHFDVKIPQPANTEFWDQSSIKPHEAPKKEEVKTESSVFKKITNAFGSFINWIKGTPSASQDVKVEKAIPVETIDSRPKLPKPQADSLDRFFEEKNKLNDRVQGIHEDVSNKIKTDLPAHRFSDAYVVLMLVALLKEQGKSRDEDGILLNDKIKEQQQLMEQLRKLKIQQDEKAHSLGKIASFVGKIAAVVGGVALTGAVLVGTIVVTAGAAAVPIALGVASAAASGTSAFIGVANLVLKVKTNDMQGQAALTGARRKELQVQIKIKMDELIEALKAVHQAFKLMSSEARKMYEAQVSLRS